MSASKHADIEVPMSVGSVWKRAGIVLRGERVHVWTWQPRTSSTLQSLRNITVACLCYEELCRLGDCAKRFFSCPFEGGLPLGAYLSAYRGIFVLRLSESLQVFRATRHVGRAGDCANGSRANCGGGIAARLNAVGFEAECEKGSGIDRSRD